MAIGAPFPANAAVLNVAASLTVPVYTLIGLATGWDTDVQENLNEIDVLGQTDPVQNLGREKMHITVSALLTVGTDAGQSVINTANASRATLKLQLLYDGTNGWHANAVPNGRKSTGKAGNGWVEAQFMWALVPSSIVADGTGPTP